jgi:hypothetical protein
MSSVPVAGVKDSVVEAIFTRVSAEGRSNTTVTLKTLGRSIRVDTINPRTSSIITIGQSYHRNNEVWNRVNEPNARNRHVEHLPGYLLAELLSRTDVTLHYLGLISLQGRTVHHIKTTTIYRTAAVDDGTLSDQLTKNSRLDLFVDATTNLVAKISFTQISFTDWRRGLPVEILYDDYRHVEGMRIPFRQKRLLGGNLTSELSITSASFNVGLRPVDVEEAR